MRHLGKRRLDLPGALALETAVQIGRAERIELRKRALIDRRRDHRREFFDERAASGRAARWGLLSIIPALSNLQPEDMVFAYQTDRNELVGLVRMVRVIGDEPGSSSRSKFWGINDRGMR